MKFTKRNLESVINILKTLNKDGDLIIELNNEYKNMDYDDVIYVGGKEKEDYITNSLMEYHNLMMVNGLMIKANVTKELIREIYNYEVQ